MKKILYILFCLIPLLAMQSCTEDLAENELTLDGKISTTISVTVPQLPDAHPQTRAMGMEPKMENLYLAVFDDNGYLLEYVQAECALAKKNKTVYEYKVNLTPTKGRTIIHFIGNGPENLHFGSETEVIGGLFTEKGDDAYWQRIELAEGIKKDENGVLAASVTEALTGVKLIRNFAWIHLNSADPNFKIQSYCVVNTHTKGATAPYLGSLSVDATQNPFAEYKPETPYETLIMNGYDGFIPSGSELNTKIPDETEWFNVDPNKENEYAYFMYERETPLSNPSFILVKGTYITDGSTEMDNRYYKVDLRNASGDYFPIIRNFKYSLTLTNVRHEGHSTAAAAAQGAGSGDVSTSMETEDFTNISNNVARLSVSYTDTTLVNQMNDLKLRYKFEVFATTGNGSQQVLNGDNVSITLGAADGGDVIEKFEKATSDVNGWREITISTTALGTARKSQDIIIKGTATVDGHTYSLDRKVTINLRPKYKMELVCDPDEIPNRLGSPFDLIIKIPGGLSKSLFPLEFQLEADAQSMTPDKGDDLPVVTGKSIVQLEGGILKDKTTIGFIKHLEWDDYDALANEGGYKSVPCHFKSNKAESATVIWAQNKYFESAKDNLGNYSPREFSGLSFDPILLPNTKNTEVKFSFSITPENLEFLQEQSDENKYIIVRLENLSKADDEDRLTYDAELGGYKFYPTNVNETLRLITTSDGATSAKVTLSAYHFEDASKLLKDKFVIPAGHIQGLTGNYTYYLYSKDPGRTQNPGNTIGGTNGQISVSDGVNSADIDLTSELYKTIMEGDGCVYVRYTTTTSNGWLQTTNYYVATVLLSDLMKEGGASLTFTERKN